MRWLYIGIAALFVFYFVVFQGQTCPDNRKNQEVDFEFVCNDGLDGDNDGLIDCDDDDCEGSQYCPEKSCNDGLDGDKDGKTDCDDPDCRMDPACGPKEGDACYGALQLALARLKPQVGGSWLGPADAGNSFVGSDGKSTTDSEGQTDITCGGIVSVPADDFQVGPSSTEPREEGIVINPENGLSFPSDGDHLVAVMGFDADIPLNDPKFFYQYGLACETDGVDENNWVPLPQYPADFFAGTDLWFEVKYTPQTSWKLSISQVWPGNSISPRGSSGAQAIIQGSALAVIVPLAEMGASDLISCRLTAFRHTGNFLGGEWNGDIYPLIEPKLLTLDE